RRAGLATASLHGSPGQPSIARRSWHTRPRDSPALGISLDRLLEGQLSGPVQPGLDLVARPADPPRDPLQRPDPGAPSPPALHGHVGVAPLVGPDHVLPADRRGPIPVR